MENTNTHNIKIDEGLVHATVKLNTLLFAFVMAMICGLSLLGLTFVELEKTNGSPESFLNLLGVFLPGYRVTVSGAWIGLFWGLVVGAISGAVIYRIYAKSIREQVIEYLNTPDLTDEDLDRATMRISGHSLGISLGTLLALGLFITTNWLVIRGTAAESYHAALLSNYLPGYEVSVLGSIIGLIEIFIIVYFFCQILSVVYNRISAARKRDI